MKLKESYIECWKTSAAPQIIQRVSRVERAYRTWGRAWCL